MPKVSVVINCHNGEKFLKECLDSIEKQSFKDFEVVFWDNCSTDNSAEIAKSYPKVKYFRGNDFVTLGKARNLALNQTQGEYVAFIDSDDLWDSKKLELQVDVLDHEPSIGMVLSNYRRYNMLKNKIIEVYKNAQRKVLGFSELIMGYHFCLSSFMIRKSSLNGLDHFFNEEFRYAEEFELFSRIAYKWPTVFLPQPLVTYRIHSSMNTMSLQDRKSTEYGIILDNLRKMSPTIDLEYPEVIKLLLFAIDYNESKSELRKGNNKKVKKLMIPYIKYNKRALCYYIAALFPAYISKAIDKIYYKDQY